MIDALLARLGYYKRDWGQKKLGKRDIDKTNRAQRWIAFYDEKEGLGEAIELIRKSYFERAGELAPGDIDGLAALSMADQICRQLDLQIKTITDNGLIEEHAQKHAAKIAALTPAQQRRL